MTAAPSASKRIAGLFARAVFLVTASVLIAGCTSVRNWWTKKKQSHGVLLSSRNIVPPPYAEPPPKPPAPALTPPPEPIPPVPAPAPAPETAKPVVQPPPVPETKPLTYKVKKGDTLWEIARMYGVSQAELAEYNNMKLTDILPVGKVLRIPPGGRYIPPEKRPKVKPRKRSIKRGAGTSGKKTTSRRSSASTARRPLPPDGKYVVKSGDSLWTIAHRYGLRVKDIKEANNLTSDTLQINQVLILPRPSAAGAAPAPPKPRLERAMPQPTPAPAQDVKPEGSLTPEPKPTGGAAAAGKLPPELERELPKTLMYTVVRGDTLESIARAYGTTVDEIKKRNPGLTNETLRPGTTITVPYNDQK